MIVDRRPLRQGDVERLRRSGQPLFALGRVVATPGVLRQLCAANYLPSTFLSRHQHGQWGNLDEEDCKQNDRAVIDGSRILSAYEVAGEKVYVITEAVDDAGNRTTTTLLLASEY
jgi:hypothetical protein